MGERLNSPVAVAWRAPITTTGLSDEDSLLGKYPKHLRCQAHLQYHGEILPQPLTVIIGQKPGKSRGNA